MFYNAKALQLESNHQDITKTLINDQDHGGNTAISIAEKMLNEEPDEKLDKDRLKKIIAEMKEIASKDVAAPRVSVATGGSATTESSETESKKETEQKGGATLQASADVEGSQQAEQSKPLSEKQKQELRLELQKHIQNDESIDQDIKKLFSRNEINLEGQIPEVHATILSIATKHFYDYNILKYLKGIKIDFNATYGQHNSNVLMYAAINKNKEVVEWLLNDDKGKQLINTQNMYGDSPLNCVMRTVGGLDPNMVQLLVNNGADIFKENNRGNDALAIAKNKLRAVERRNIPEERSIIADLKNIKTILEEAKEKKNQELRVEFQGFIKKYPAEKHRVEEIEKLFRRGEVNLEKVDDIVHLDILLIAVQNFDNNDILKYLESIKINFNAINDKSKINVLMMLAEYGKTSMMKWLFNNTKAKELINEKNNESNTA